MTGTVSTLWVDASSGASGDMLLGALVGAGVRSTTIQRRVDAVSPEPVTLRVESVTRNGFAATRVHVEVADSAHHRSWRDVRALLLDAPPRRRRARPRAAGLRAARGRRGHRARPRPVRRALPRGGALDAIADVVGRLRGLRATSAPTEVVVTPIAVGSGTDPRRARHPAGPAAGGGRTAAPASRRTPARPARPRPSCARRPAPRC